MNELYKRLSQYIEQRRLSVVQGVPVPEIR